MMRKRLRRVLKEAIAGGSCPGAVLLVACKTRVLAHEALGHAALVPEERVARKDTIFDLASLTKGLCTGLLAGLALQQSRLALGDTVANWVPELAGTDAGSVTLRSLYSHTSGLSDSKLYDARAPKKNRAKDLWAAVMKTTSICPEGTRYLYQDINYIVLGRVLEAVFGDDLASAFHKQVAQPLELALQFNPQPELLDRVAPTEPAFEAPTKEPLHGVVHDPRARALAGVAGNAGLFGTAEDVHRLVCAIAGHGSPAKALRLAPAVRRLLVQPISPPQLHPRTLGFDTDPDHTGPRGDLFPEDGFGHTGYTGTSLWVDRASGLIILLLTSRLHPDGSGSVVALRRRIANIVALEAKPAGA